MDLRMQGPFQNYMTMGRHDYPEPCGHFAARVLGSLPHTRVIRDVTPGRRNGRSKRRRFDIVSTQNSTNRYRFDIFPTGLSSLGLGHVVLEHSPTNFNNFFNLRTLHFSGEDYYSLRPVL